MAASSESAPAGGAPEEAGQQLGASVKEEEKGGKEDGKRKQGAVGQVKKEVESGNQGCQVEERTGGRMEGMSVEEKEKVMEGLEQREQDQKERERVWGLLLEREGDKKGAEELKQQKQQSEGEAADWGEDANSCSNSTTQERDKRKRRKGVRKQGRSKEGEDSRGTRQRGMGRERCRSRRRRIHRRLPGGSAAPARRQRPPIHQRPLGRT